jgi:anti-anti-sigma regulatory factor
VAWVVLLTELEAVMLDVHTENIGELAVVECEAGVLQNEAAFTLWEAVTSQRNARIILLDLSEVRAVEGAASLGMLVFLQRWAHDHNIRFKLFNPSKSVHDRLECFSSMAELDIATIDEVSALLADVDHGYAIAA